MGTSRLSYLQKIQSGELFTEGFENSNFLTAEGWTTVQGTPINTDNTALVTLRPTRNMGISSFICSGTGATLSIIKKTVTAYSNQVGTGAHPAASVWFYDDGTTTAGTGPFFKVKTSSGLWLQVGVRNTISTTKYVYNIAATTTEDNFVASGVNRSVGWHKFSIVLLIGANVQIYIDAVGSNRTIAPGADEKFSEVHICSGAVGDTGVTFGYFDNVGVYLSESVYFLNGSSASRSCKGWDTSGNFIFSGNLPTTGALTVVGNTYTFPFPMHFQISSEILTNCECATPLVYINPGDVYIYQTIDFQRKITTWDPAEESISRKSQSTGGQSQTIFNAYKPRHTFTVRLMQGYDWKRKLNNFFNYVDKGSPFSIINDSSFCGFGIISAAIVNTQKSVAIYDNLSTVATDNFIVGRTYRIFNLQNTRRQRVTLESKGANSLVFSEYLTDPVQQGDFICEETFYPFLEIGQNMDGYSISGKRVIYGDWNQGVAEYTGV